MSEEAISKTTFEPKAGLAVRATVNVAEPPASVVLSEIPLTANPGVSLSTLKKENCVFEDTELPGMLL